MSTIFVFASCGPTWICFVCASLTLLSSSCFSSFARSICLVGGSAGLRAMMFAVGCRVRAGSFGGKPEPPDVFSATIGTGTA
jgi:hypothetical protein